MPERLPVALVSRLGASLTPEPLYEDLRRIVDVNDRLRRCQELAAKLAADSDDHRRI